MCFNDVQMCGMQIMNLVCPSDVSGGIIQFSSGYNTPFLEEAITVL